jgi:hypothetical protein
VEVNWGSRIRGHRYKNWYKTILNSTQNKNKVYHKTNLNNNIKLQVFRTIYRTKLFPEHFMSIPVGPTDRIQYHRSYYKRYTSKINLENFEPVEAQMNASACGSVRTS